MRPVAQNGYKKDPFLTVANYGIQTSQTFGPFRKPPKVKSPKLRFEYPDCINKTLYLFLFFFGDQYSHTACGHGEASYIFKIKNNFSVSLLRVPVTEIVSKYMMMLLSFVSSANQLAGYLTYRERRRSYWWGDNYQVLIWVECIDYRAQVAS